VKVVQLSMLQRINLEGLIRSQRLGVEDGLFTLFDIRNKVKVDPAEKAKYVREVPGVGAFVDQTGMVDLPELAIEFGREEVKMLKTVIAGWKQFGPDDAEWLLPLQKQLDD
jgi:hypothetical protein